MNKSLAVVITSVFTVVVCAAAAIVAMEPVSNLPSATPVASISKRGKLMRYFDETTGVLCYVLNDRGSAPSCLKVTSAVLVPAQDEPLTDVQRSAPQR